MKRSLLARVLALMLALTMVVGVVPATVFATETDNTENIEPAENKPEGTGEGTGEDEIEIIDEGDDEIIDEGDDEIIDEGDDEIIDEGDDEIIDEGDDEIIDEGDDEIIDEGDDEIIDEGDDEIIDEGDEEIVEEGADGTGAAFDVDAATDAQLLAYVQALEGDAYAAFMNALTTEQQNRISQLLVNPTVEEPATHTVFSKTDTVIAPGVTQSIRFAYAADGKQMAYYALTADVTRDDVIVQTSYKEQYVNKNFGMEKLTNQIAYADALHTDKHSDRYISDYYKVVGGVNASFYNMTTGQPSGVTYLDGVQIGESASYNNFFAILKDGTAVIDYTKNLNDDYRANIWQACAGSQVLVWEGKDITANINGSYNTDRHSRTCVGITADGQVVMMSLDGRQEPFSCGGTMHELAQIMLELGCVSAINLDGGGSTTFAARQAGANDVTIVNRPSDGSERSISSGLIIASLAAPSDVFDRATLTPENNYVTPGSTVSIAAKGVSPAGTAAEIPAEAVWQLADSTMGTVEEGVFTSNGTTGDAVVQMVYNDTVVGSATIHVVVPEKLAFNSDIITVPYGKTVTLGITATYGLNEVALKQGDVKFTLEDEAMGVIDGLSFTATADEAAFEGGAITVALVMDETICGTAQLSFGKGSEVVMDFEDNDIGDMYIVTGYPQYGPMGSKKDENGNFYYNGQNELGRVYIADASNGKVHDGNYALAVECDYSQAYETGYHMLTMQGFEFTVPANAQTLGMWIYLPELEELSGTSMRICGKTEGSTSYDVSSPWLWDNCEPYGWENDGWRYLTMDISGYSKAITFSYMQLYICDRDNADVNYYFADHASVNGKFTYYFDNFTVDYSSAVDDREAPVFSSVVYVDEFTNDAPELNGQSTTSNVLSFTATVADRAADNASGMDASSVKAYIDGAVVSHSYVNGKIVIPETLLADGVHTIRFEASDKMGNLSYAERQITVKADSGLNTVSVVPQDPDAHKILIGSVYWVDLVAKVAQKIDAVTVKLNLNSVSQWELDHMVVTPGFAATYSVDEITNNATIKITRTGEVADGTTVLAQLPIRTWESTITQYEGYEDQTPQKLWERKIIWPQDIKLSADYGVISFTDGTTGSFSMAPLAVLTELYGNYAELNGNGDYANKKSWHIHTVEPVADKAASCTEDGYTGRSVCAVCNSPVVWGTKQAATGHNFELVDGVLKCVCGELFNGEKDGKVYADGVAAQGWVGDSYYNDGVKITGLQLIDGFYYDFGEDGICAGQLKYTGLIEKEEGLFYAKFGELFSGWVLVGDKDYYFGEDFKAVGGTNVRINGYIYSFDENFVLVKGMWTKNSEGRIRYVWADEAIAKAFREIDGKLYCFDANGWLLTGDQYVRFTHGDPYTMYYITDDGVVLGKMEGFSGLHKSSAGVFMVENGEAQYAGLVKDAEGNFYYISSSRKAVVSTAYSVGEAKTNGLLPAGRYEFDAEGKMINPPVQPETPDPENPNPDNPDQPEVPDLKQGLVVDEDGEIRFYVDGVAQYAGLVQDAEGNYYYINSSKQAVKNCSYSIGAAKTNGLLPAGTYAFGADGKMINAPKDEPETPDPEQPQLKQGLVVDEDGEVRFYKDGVAQYAGLVQDADGNYYYINSSKQAVKNCEYSIGAAKTNGLLPAGTYTFGADGKMVNVPKDEPETPDPEQPQLKQGLVVDEDGEIRFYKDGVAQYAGVVQDAEGNLYYINSSKKAVKNCSYGIGAARTNGLIPAGTYQFGADGKMITK